jgi:NhaP-type Na+/H+ or K+/H+ antiporter
VFGIVGILLGPAAWDVLHGTPTSEGVKLLAELTLAILLFADASTVRLTEVRGDAQLPGRLLLIGLPLTIVAGTLIARLFYPGPEWAVPALIASILAPTDAALGLPVVTNTAVPVRIRRALNVESGLNDGIATPFVTLFLLIAAAGEHAGPAHWAADALKELGLALVAALLIGVLGGVAVTAARRRGWTTPTSERLVVLALAFLSYETSVAMGGNGFVAAFVGGILFGAATRRRLTEPTEFAENLSLYASFLVWAVFGAFLAGPVIKHGLDGRAIGYALLSLTVVRMLPVAVALAGTRLRWQTQAFVGWFGPRGLASVVFLLVALDQLHDTPAADPLIAAVTWTVLLSVLLHGLSAAPLATRYGGWIRAAAGRVPNLPECADAPEPRIRRRTLAGD